MAEHPTPTTSDADETPRVVTPPYSTACAPIWVHCGKFGALARVRPVSMKLDGFSGSKKPERRRLALTTLEMSDPCVPANGTTAI